jgi:cytoskeletal protein CcmA (bactofilin family)
MFGRKKPAESAAPLPEMPMAASGPKQSELAMPAPAAAEPAPIKAVDDELPPMPSHLRAVGKPVLPTTPASVPPGVAPMAEVTPPTPTFRPEIAKRPNADLTPKASVQATAMSSSSSSSGTPTEPKVLLIGREISLSGQITACDRVVVEGRVEAQLTESRFVEITETGQFKGSAEVEEAEIRGRFEGRLSVRGRLLIRGSGKVSGEIAYGQIEIECGGEISGTVQTVASGGRMASPAAAE